MKIKLFLTIALFFFTSGYCFAQDTVTSAGAKNFIGETKIVKGKVAGVFTSKNGTVIFNFDNDHPNETFSAVIFKDTAIKFDNIKEGSILTLRGKIELYKEKPQIILREQDQILGVE